MEKFEFLISAVSAEKLLGLINTLTIGLQNTELDILSALAHVQDVVDSLQASRTDDAFSELFCEASDLAELIGITPEMPRVTGRQQHRVNPTGLGIEEYFRMRYYDFVDHLISEIQTRVFSQGLKKLSKAAHLLPKRIIGASDDVIEEISAELCGTYATDLPNPSNLRPEINQWKNMCIRKNLKDLTLKQAFVESNSGFYPNIKVLLQLLLALPMTTASAERTFSYLRMLKNYL